MRKLALFVLIFFAAIGSATYASFRGGSGGGGGGTSYTFSGGVTNTAGTVTCDAAGASTGCVTLGAHTWTGTQAATNYEIGGAGAYYNTSIAQSLVLESSKQPASGTVSTYTNTNGWNYNTVDAFLFCDKSNNTSRFCITADGMPRPGMSPSNAQPACSATYRNVQWTTMGGAGVADKVEQCMKGTADTYSWVLVVTAL